MQLYAIKRQPLSRGWQHIAILPFLTEVGTVLVIYSKRMSETKKLDKMAHLWKIPIPRTEVETGEL